MLELLGAFQFNNTLVHKNNYKCGRRTQTRFSPLFSFILGFGYELILDKYITTFSNEKVVGI